MPQPEVPIDTSADLFAHATKTMGVPTNAMFDGRAQFAAVSARARACGLNPYAVVVAMFERIDPAVPEAVRVGDELVRLPHLRVSIGGRPRDVAAVYEMADDAVAELIRNRSTQGEKA